jgi:hypothetical protein
MRRPGKIWSPIWNPWDWRSLPSPPGAARWTSAKAKSKKRERPLKLVEKKGELYKILRKKHKRKKPIK